jgi:hypothetical protein
MHDLVRLARALSSSLGFSFLRTNKQLRLSAIMQQETFGGYKLHPCVITRYLGGWKPANELARIGEMSVTQGWTLEARGWPLRPHGCLSVIAKLDAEVINASDAHPKGLLAVLRADRVDPKFSETRVKVG